eukprot:TCALIF_02834-PA protein Name:"Protein of unknown function" AED:0.53 eAED:0.53 QI:17/0.66/0.25/1/0.66/0.5/4/0/213
MFIKAPFLEYRVISRGREFCKTCAMIGHLAVRNCGGDSPANLDTKWDSLQSGKDKSSSSQHTHSPSSNKVPHKQAQIPNSKTVLEVRTSTYSTKSADSVLRSGFAMLGTGDGERKKDLHKKSDESIDSKKKEALEIIQESKAIGHDIAILSRKYKTTAVKMSPKIMGRRFSRVKRNSCFSVIQMKIKLRQKAKDARQKNEVGREKSKFNEEEI